MKAKWEIPSGFEDIGYEKWVEQCGASFVKLEPISYVIPAMTIEAFVLHIAGSQEAIDRFSADMDCEPDEVTK